MPPPELELVVLPPELLDELLELLELPEPDEPDEPEAEVELLQPVRASAAAARRATAPIAGRVVLL
jgi:hypothetical protein